MLRYSSSLRIEDEDTLEFLEIRVAPNLDRIKVLPHLDDGFWNHSWTFLVDLNKLLLGDADCPSEVVYVFEESLGFVLEGNEFCVHSCRLVATLGIQSSKRGCHGSVEFGNLRMKVRYDLALLLQLSDFL